MERYWVYDFRTAPVQRWIDPDRRERLEHYSFEKRGDGRYALEVQAGWPGSWGHWDGAGSTFELPGEWFDSGWEAFLDRLTAKYPPGSYGVGKEELLGREDLRSFLGFR